MSYSIDFRRHALAVREREGLSFSAAAERFGVGVASLKRWSKRLEPLSYKRKSRKIDLERLAEDVRQFPDAYQYERAARFGVTQKAIWQALGELGETYKKSPQPSQGERRRAAGLRREDQAL